MLQKMQPAVTVRTLLWSVSLEFGAEQAKVSNVALAMEYSLLVALALKRLDTPALYCKREH